jgi:ABC-2 type transport system permease protein
MDERAPDKVVEPDEVVAPDKVVGPERRPRVRRNGRLSWGRFMAVLAKEFIQMRRDRITFAMMIGIPIMQLVLFGYAINSDPRHLPTLIAMGDSGPVSRAVISAMEHSSFFDFRGTVGSAAEGEDALRNGEANFVVVIPSNFERDVVRGARPQILIDADASDPAATGGPVGALSGIVETAMREALTGPLASLGTSPPPVELVVHRQYNPEQQTAINIVPGLLAIIMSMTMVIITAVAIVRETERGTIETLLATPVRPIEVMAGKILPYVLVGYVQTLVFLIAAQLMFGVPFEGGVGAFVIGLNLYIVVNLALGFLISTLAGNQMQAMQLAFMTILPSILLSGFMFPFAGMPGWAQTIGTGLPATHFLRILRKVMLKGATLPDITGDLTALLIIMAAITVVAMLRYRKTLD